MNKYLLIYLLFLSINSFAQEGNKEVPVDSTKSGYKKNIKLGNPTNKEVEMELNDYTAPSYRWNNKFMDGWFDFKKRSNEKHGLQLSINYTSVFMGATSTITDSSVSNAAGGIFDATLKWKVYEDSNQNTGTFVLWTDFRHLFYGDVTPQLLFLETGSGSIGATKFNKWNFHVYEFYWHQTFFKNRWDIVIGKIDMTDWFTYNGLLHPLLHFTDLAFSVNPTVNWANSGFGIGTGGWLTKQKNLALLLGIADVAGANLVNPDFFDLGMDQWWNGKFLKMIELHYTPSRSEYYSNRIGVTVWHSDELLISDDSFFQSPSSKGFSIQATRTNNDNVVTTATFGLSDGEGTNTLSKINIALAKAWSFPSHDLFGVGFNYSSPGKALQQGYSNTRGQFLSEVFYRWTLSKTTSITPIAKLVINPSLDPNTDILMYYGIRGRISL